MVGPRANAVDWLDHAQVGHMAVAASEEVFTRSVACGRRMRCQREGTGKIRLQKTFDAIQMFQDQLVASVQLDARFPVNAFCIELRAKPAFWPCAVAP